MPRQGLRLFPIFADWQKGAGLRPKEAAGTRLCDLSHKLAHPRPRAPPPPTVLWCLYVCTFVRPCVISKLVTYAGTSQCLSYDVDLCGLPPSLSTTPTKTTQGLEIIMSRLGAVRSVEVAPCVPDGLPGTLASAAAGSANGRPLDFDVHALLENMPQPRALAKGKAGGGGGGGGRVGGAEGGGGVVGGLSVGLNVDAWVQFASFRGFGRALRALQGRVLQKVGAELVCEYRLGVDKTGYMTEERRRERGGIRARQEQEVYCEGGRVVVLGGVGF